MVYEVPVEKVALTEDSLGIDLGIKELAVCSDGKVYGNINKTSSVKRIEKKLKREQRRLSRMVRENISGYVGNRSPIFKRPIEECKNIQKQKRSIQLISRKLKNVRNNYLHQTTTEIVKTKPSRIVTETLNVKNMMKNKYLAKAIAEQKFAEFERQIEYKCERYGIEFVKVPMFYPSSKTCSACGCIKSDLKLSDRTFCCEDCGSVIDRDLNAAINLANYKFI